MPDTFSNTVLPDSPRYLAYYRLRDAPFRVDAGRRALWVGRAHREVLAALTAAMRQEDGVFLLTGDAGTGKTSLLDRLTEDLGGAGVVIGRLPPSVFELPELFQAVADAFGLGGPFPSSAAFAARFREFLGSARAQGKRAILVIDEAQGLGDELLRKVFALSTIGTFEEYPCAIILAGQPELDAALAKDQHAGLRQRIAGRYALDPLTPAEVGEYIQARLRAAGAEEVVFDPDAVRQIASIARGAPGLINVVCERALATGHRRRARVIDAGIIDASLGEIGSGDGESRPDGQGHARFVESVHKPVRSHRPARIGSVLGIALLAVLAAAGYGLYTARYARMRSDSGRPPAAAVETKRAAAPVPAGPGQRAPGAATAGAAVERSQPEPPADAGRSGRDTAPAGGEQGEQATAKAPAGVAQGEREAATVPAGVERRERNAVAAPADVERRDRDAAPGLATTGRRDRIGPTTPPTALGAGKPGPRQSELLGSPPAGGGPARRQDASRRERTKQGAADVETSRPGDARVTAPSRERAAGRPAEKDAEANDPGAIIDWLMKESGR